MYTTTLAVVLTLSHKDCPLYSQSVRNIIKVTYDSAVFSQMAAHSYGRQVASLYARMLLILPTNFSVYTDGFPHLFNQLYHIY